MNLINRAKNILISPKTEWETINSETGEVQGLFTGYALILAILPVIGTLLFGLTFSGPYGIRFGLNYLLVSAIMGYIVSLGVLFGMTYIANALAPTFEGKKDHFKAAQLLVYSATAVWVASIFVILGGIGALLALIGFGYAAYLLYLGCQTMMQVPQKNAIGYTAVTIVIWIIISFVINALLSQIILRSMLGTPTIVL